MAPALNAPPLDTVAVPPALISAPVAVPVA
jgi:hypothetical protein